MTKDDEPPNQPKTTHCTCINHTSYPLQNNPLTQQLQRLTTLLNNSYQTTLDTIEIGLLTPKQMQQLNHTFCNHNSPTDILTFPEHSDLPPYHVVGGQLALCPNLLFKHNPKTEPATLLLQHCLHGLLHLYGLKHNYSPASLNNLHTFERNLFQLLKPDPSQLLPTT